MYCIVYLIGKSSTVSPSIHTYSRCLCAHCQIAPPLYPLYVLCFFPLLFRQSEGDSEVHKTMVQHWRMTRKYMLSTVSLSMIVYVNVHGVNNREGIARVEDIL